MPGIRRIRRPYAAGLRRTHRGDELDRRDETTTERDATLRERLAWLSQASQRINESLGLRSPSSPSAPDADLRALLGPGAEGEERRRPALRAHHRAQAADQAGYRHRQHEVHLRRALSRIPDGQRGVSKTEKGRGLNLSSSYRTSVKVKRKVLDFIKSGGPECTVLRTFRWEVAL